MFEWVRFYFNRLFSSKYKITGKCNCCGQCCRKILMTYNGRNVRTDEEFEELKKISRKYSHFYCTGKDADGSLLYTCKSLTEDNKCKDYFFRSLYCRKYPEIDRDFVMAGGTLLDGCGYRMTVTKKFSDYLS